VGGAVVNATAVEQDVDQLRVIDLPADARVFVVAGPGAGKTWTLLRRSKQLAERDEIDASRILVLSFTSAVVRELRRRDREANRFASVFPETFDAFATRLLSHGDDDGWRTGSFDTRILAATQLILDGGGDETLGAIDHILVDEVQDLVGCRAEFVGALLQLHAGGFTSFGDPAQAIYEHERGRGGAALIPELLDGLADEVVQLSGNHRASGGAALTVARLRDGLLDGDGADGVAATTDALFAIDSVGTFELLPQLVPVMLGTKAVLCRDNATALVLSRALYSAGVDHRVRRATSDRPVAGWVAAVFDGRERLARAVFDARIDRLAELGLPELPDRDTGWRTLNRMDPGARGGPVRASEVGSRIAVGRVPYELYDEPAHDLVVSSIHRAKGLEFDRCVVVEWDGSQFEDPLLEARVLFVALSRARSVSMQADARPVHRAPWFRSPKASGRLTKRGFKDWQTFGIEILADDVHPTDPAGTIGFEADASEVQERLVTTVRPADPVRLVHVGEHDFGSGPGPLYVVEHVLGPIGVSGVGFTAAMRRQLGAHAPALITEVRVEGLETVKGPLATGEAAGLGRAGLWLRPRLIGLGEFSWNGR
jgi:hypothetical protein